MLLFYHPAGKVSGPALAEYMGIEHTRYPLKTTNALIRWGTFAKIPFTPPVEINKRSHMRRYGTRLKQLTLLKEGGVRVPVFSDTPLDGPQLGRKEYPGRQSTMGRGITYYPDEAPSGHPLYTQYYPKQRQFRVHVFNLHSDSYKTRTRELVHNLELEGSDASNLEDAWAQPVWNLSTGFTYRVVQGDRPNGVIPQAKQAIKALGLDFGAVDVIVHDGIPYVLEVNTAPGLSALTLKWYARNMGLLLGLLPVDMPGYNETDQTEIEDDVQ